MLNGIIFSVAFYLFVGCLFSLSANIAFLKTSPVLLMLGWPIYSGIIIYKELKNGQGEDNKVD